MQVEVAKKIAFGSNSIQGWFSVEAAMLFACVDEIQKKNQITGDIFEIGCHHGRSTVLLKAMANPPAEKLCVCDLFGGQDGNISGSGRGDLEVFRQNLEQISSPGLDLRIFQRNSNCLTPEEIGPGYRFFHIDGGHNADEALSDMKLAAATICEKGIIALDDPFRPEWPGVTEALIRFLDEFDEFCPIAVGFNKLLLTRRTCATLYVDNIQNKDTLREYGLWRPWHLKQLPFHGFSLNIFFLPTILNQNPLEKWLRNYYQTHLWMRKPLLSPVFAVAKWVMRKR